MQFPQFLAVCFSFFCFARPIAAMLAPHHHAAGAAPPVVVPPVPGLNNVDPSSHNFVPPPPLSDEHFKRFEVTGDHEVEYEEDKPMFHARRLLQTAALYSINLINKCKFNVYVKGFTAVKGEHVPDGGNLALNGGTGLIQVPKSYSDVEIFPLVNCQGAGGTQCQSGGCKSHPSEHGACSKSGEGKNSAVRFDFHNGKNEAANCYFPLNGFNIGALVEPHNPKCEKLQVTMGSQQTVNCDNSGGYTITYCAPNTSAETNGSPSDVVKGNEAKNANAEVDGNGD